MCKQRGLLHWRDMNTRGIYPLIFIGVLQLRQKNMQGTVWWVSQAWASQAKAESERFLCPFQSQCSRECGQDNVDTLHKAH